MGPNNIWGTDSEHTSGWKRSPAVLVAQFRNKLKRSSLWLWLYRLCPPPPALSHPPRPSAPSCLWPGGCQPGTCQPKLSEFDQPQTFLALQCTRPTLSRAVLGPVFLFHDGISRGQALPHPMTRVASGWLHPCHPCARQNALRGYARRRREATRELGEIVPACSQFCGRSRGAGRPGGGGWRRQLRTVGAGGSAARDKGARGRDGLRGAGPDPPPPSSLRVTVRAGGIPARVCLVPWKDAQGLSGCARSRLHERRGPAQRGGARRMRRRQLPGSGVAASLQGQDYTA